MSARSRRGWLRRLATAGLVVGIGTGSAAARAGDREDFFKAIEIDDARGLARLLARGIDPNTPDDAGQVALFVALRGESLQAASLLIAHPGLRVDAANAQGETPLMMAALRGQVEHTRALLARGAALERPGWTPLHYAASGPGHAVVGLLLQAGAAVDARSPNGTTPLMMAARYGPEESVDLLLARGADGGVKNDQGLQAHDFARLAGRESLTRRLQARAR